MKNPATLLLTTALGGLFFACSLQGQSIPGTDYVVGYEDFADVSRPGAHKRDSWFGMNQYNYDSGIYGHSGAWPQGMRPNFAANASGSIQLYKSNLDYSGSDLSDGAVATMGIYTKFTVTPFYVTETAALANLATISFQAFTRTGAPNGSPMDPGFEYYGPDGDFNTLPTLTVFGANGESESVAMSFSDKYMSEEVTFNHGGFFMVTQYENKRLFEWDVSIVNFDIIGFQIDFSMLEHTVLRSIQVDQFAAVPEPATLALLSAAAGLCAAVVSRRRRAALAGA